MKRLPALFALTAFITACIFANIVFADDSVENSVKPVLNEKASAKTPAVVIYTARKIITMERDNPITTAVAISNGKIVAAGSFDEVKAALGDSKYSIDDRFSSKIIMPGFIDQHLHPVLGALTMVTEVIAPEDWVMPGRTFKAASTPEEYIARLKEAVGRVKDPKEWFFSWGYHKLWHGNINRKMLDEINATIPIVIWQRSCHEFYLNTAAINALGLTEESQKDKGEASEMYDWGEGHWWETGLNLILDKVFGELASPKRMAFGLKQMVEYLHRKGVTAYNEPGALYAPDMWELYEEILGAEDTPFYSYFIVDGREFVDRGVGPAESMAEGEKVMAEHRTGKVSFFPKQIKLFADGAIISQLMQMKDGYTDGHHGEWMMTPEHLEERFRLYWNAGYQIHIHVNGDLGLEVLLGIMERAMEENPRYDHRTVIVHFANSTEEQVGRIARLGAIISANPYYTVGFADMYGKYGLGPERADAMVRSGSAIKNHIHLSFHSDLPMGPSDPLFFVWCAVNRITPSVRVAGPEERISVDDALRAITIEAAYSWRKEGELGSIAPGKTANFTVLEEDPYEVDAVKIKDIPVWGTLFEGRIFPVDKNMEKL